MSWPESASERTNADYLDSGLNAPCDERLSANSVYLFGTEALPDMP